MSIEPERDEQLSALYRETFRPEPPARIDAAILAAARREAVAASRSPARPWWQRWAIPVSVTAIALLSASLTLLVSREQERAQFSPPVPPATAPETVPEPKREERESRRQGSPAAGTPDAVAPVAPSSPPSSRSAKVSPPGADREPGPAAPPEGVFVPDPGPHSDVSSERAAPASAPAPGHRAQESFGPKMQSAPADAAAGAISSEHEVQRLAPAEPAAANKASRARDRMVEQGKDAVEPWIGRIRSLLRQGRDAEALRELRALRQAHPDAVLPADLAAIERP